jgi:hypothetical protein
MIPKFSRKRILSRTGLKMTRAGYPGVIFHFIQQKSEMETNVAPKPKPGYGIVRWNQWKYFA